MATPTCSNDCTFDLPAVSFSNCNPEVNNSEIGRIFIAKSTAAAFANWLNASEWLARMSQSSVVGDDYIRVLTVIGDKPAATSVFKDISNGRRVVVGKDHVLNYTIDDVTQLNYDFMRQLECGGTYKIWYETIGGKMYGGNDGITVNLDQNDVLPRGQDEVEVINGVMTWRSKFSPERGTSPIFGGDVSSIPSVFDALLEFTSATDDTAFDVSGTAPANDAEQEFAFNKIVPTEGTPTSMSIRVSAVEELVVDFPSDYLGQYFKYTDKAGAIHYGTFQSGTVSF